MTIFKKQLVILDPAGRFANRLQTASYAIAFARDRNYQLHLFSMSGYDHYVVETSRTRFGSTLKKIAHVLIRTAFKVRLADFLPKTKIFHGTYSNPTVLSALAHEPDFRKSWIVLVRGYYVYCAPEMLVRNASEVRKKLTPRANTDSLRYLTHLQSRTDVTLIGLHIRRTDYEFYQGGKHFFSFETYALSAQTLMDTHPELRFVFIICSDEVVPETAFWNLEWLNGPGTVLEDLVALSMCNYVMGPFSTFNRWGAFYGDVPRYELTEDVSSLSLVDFKKVTDLAYPRNRKIIE